MSPDDASRDTVTPDEIRAAFSRLDYLLIEIEAVVAGGATLDGGVRTAFECLFDVVDARLLDVLLADRRRRPPPLRTGDGQILSRLAELIGTIEPTLDPLEARLAAGSVARVALAYLVAPELPRSRAIDELTAVALTILVRAHR